MASIDDQSLSRKIVCPGTNVMFSSSPPAWTIWKLDAGKNVALYFVLSFDCLCVFFVFVFVFVFFLHACRPAWTISEVGWRKTVALSQNFS